jgi:hypothetical protein
MGIGMFNEKFACQILTHSQALVATTLSPPLSHLNSPLQNGEVP